jgi:hypothetical protein
VLTDVVNIGQTTAGGQFPQKDCFEENASALLRHFAGVPGVAQATVADLEQWLIAHGGDPSQGTTLELGAACLTAHGLPSHTTRQPLEEAADRQHYSIPLIRSTDAGLPAALGSQGHYVTYLGGGWYRNPANGTLANSPAVLPAYSGYTIEVDVQADNITGDDEVLSPSAKNGISTLISLATLGRTTGDDGKRAARIGNNGENINEITSELLQSAESQKWLAKINSLKV